MEAVVFVTSKPIDAFQHRKWDPGFKFLAVPFEDFKLLSAVHTDCGRLSGPHPAGQQVETIAIPTILAAFNWPKGSDRYKRVARLTDNLFSRFEKLRGPGFHPNWKNVNLNAKVPGLDRFPAAQEWLDNANSSRLAVTPRLCWQQRFCTTASPDTFPSPEQRRLFQEFLDWRRKQGK